MEFTLLENGDVVWSYSENFERLPLLDCDTYELLRERDGFTVEILLRLGAWKGQSPRRIRRRVKLFLTLLC